MTRINLFIIFLTCIIQSNLFAQDKPVYNCYKINQAITMDGQAAEEAWSNAEKGHFTAMDGTVPRLVTEFMWLWDDQYLYGFFHIADDNLWASMKNRDDYLWNENVMEFFIDDDNSPKSYVEFEFNPLNTILDLYVLNKYNARKDIRQLWEWNCDGLKSAVFVKGTINNSKDLDEYWNLEVAIPFSQFYSAPNNPPVAGDEWKVDFCRGEGKENPSKDEYSAWAPPAFHNPLSYGVLKFLDKQK